MVPWPEAASAQPLGARCSQSFRVLPLLSHPPYSPGWAEGENRAGLQGMARNKMPPSPSRGGGACHELQPGQRTEELASVCRAGSGTLQGGTPWTEHSLRKLAIWVGAGGASGVF